MLSLLLLFAINLYFAWRYAPLDIDPDFALFNMAGQTGAWYGRDFVDCKSPLVHIWFWLLSLGGRSVYGVRFLHYIVTGIPGLVYSWTTKDFWGGLAFTILIHSGFLYAFHGNVGDIPAGLILLAITAKNPWAAVSLFVISVLYEPKLIAAFFPWAALNGFWWQSTVWLAIGAITAGIIWYWKNEWWNWLIEANFTIPKRMNKARKGLYPFMPSFTSNAFVYIGMWLIAGVMHKPDILYWFPAICYFLLLFMGQVIRPNHLLPLCGWFAATGLSPAWAIALSSVDVISAGLYLGDIWMRFYPGLRNVIKEAREVGEWLRDKAGSLWLNSMYSEIYIWAKKAPQYGMTEQVEIASVAKERRKRMKVSLAKNPPDWVVDQPGHQTKFDPAGYKPVAKSIYFVIYKRT